MNIRHQFNLPKEKGEIITQPSMTIPNQALTIQDLISRFTRGLPIEGGRVEIWEGENPSDWMPDLKRMDLSEREDLKNHTKQYIADYKANVAFQQNKKQNTTEVVDLN